MSLRDELSAPVLAQVEKTRQHLARIAAGESDQPGVKVTYISDKYRLRAEAMLTRLEITLDSADRHALTDLMVEIDQLF